ncbi:MAG TPA: LytR C-terminal domain-containing protein, partial [Thermoleophilaceae bacterium]|nr:LytR C-terminal domain-containing protein [Thermoleophilaceae bacterium]
SAGSAGGAASGGTAAPAKPAEAGQNAASQTADRKAAPDAPAPGSPAPKPAPGNAGAPKDGAANAGAPAAQPAPRPATSPPVPPPTRTASPASAGRPGGPTRPTAQPTTVLPPPGKQPWYRSLLSNPLYAVLAVAGVLIVGGAAAFGITQLASDGGADSSDSQSAGAGNDNQTQADGGGGGADNGKDKPRGGGAVRPGSVTVAVLNGTTVPGLAATLADQVTSAGFKAGTVANFTNNQQLAESVVQYSSGHEREAAAVSRRLGIDQREVATPDSRELAGDATVIVIAGGDKAP